MLKRFSFILLILGTMSFISLDTKDVPSKVKITFETLFPTATSQDWEEDETEYYVYFENGAHNAEAFFSKSGQWIQTNLFIKYEELPVTVQILIEKEYKEEIPFLDLVRIETPEAIHYLVTGELEGVGINFLFSENGKLLSEE